MLIADKPFLIVIAKSYYDFFIELVSSERCTSLSFCNFLLPVLYFYPPFPHFSLLRGESCFDIDTPLDKVYPLITGFVMKGMGISVTDH